MRLTRMTAVALTAMAAIAAPASAKTITLRYFFKPVSVTLTNAAGHSLDRHARPVAGDMGDEISLGYVGSHKHHAKRWTVSSDLRCVFSSSTRATCDSQIAVGGSMLLLNRINVNFQASPERLTINGGTGVFHRAHGTLTAVSLHHTKTSDVTIRIRI